MNELRILPIEGVGEVVAGDDLGLLIVDAAGEGTLIERDILVVTQKVVSKAEGRVLPAADKAAAIEAGSARILRRVGDVTISETHHGFVCANAGVDESNMEGDRIALLPVDPDASARRIRSRVKHLIDVDIGVIVSDTFGRAWRVGQTDVAIGVAGFEPVLDHRGTRDRQGRRMIATEVAVADELAGAAEMVMGKADNICAAIVRGARVKWGRGAAIDLIRPFKEDFFR